MRVCRIFGILGEAGMADKQKAHKGALKRMRVSATGKIRYRRSFAAHRMSGKSGNRRRRLRKAAYLTTTNARMIAEMIRS